MPEPLRYRISEAAEALSVSTSQMEKLIRERGIRCHQDLPGGHRYISAEALRQYIRDREDEPVMSSVVGRRRAG